MSPNMAPASAASAGPPINPEPTVAAEVTVVIPLYNKAHTIERAIRSVQAQKFGDIELVVVDDGSTDGSGDVALLKLDDRARLVRQDNAGPGAARNTGVATSDAALLAFLDGDDEWRADFLCAATKALSTHPDCIAYVCGYDSGAFRERRPNKVRALGKEAGPATLDFSLSGAELKMHIDALHSSCVVVRRSAFENAGGFYDKSRCTYGEDSFLWLQVLFAGAIYWDPAEHVRFHVEDSDLGFATTIRSMARPISLHGSQIEAPKAPEGKSAFKRTVSEFVEKDIQILIASQSFREALKLRLLHKASPLTLARDFARSLRSRVRWLCQRAVH